MRIDSYSLRISYDGSDSNGMGAVTIDGIQRTVSWQTGGRSMNVAVDGKDASPEFVEEFSEWTDAWDVVEAKLKELGGDDMVELAEGFEALVDDGTVRYLISENVVLVGTLVPADY